jgi:hypothetical protein
MDISTHKPYRLCSKRRHGDNGGINTRRIEPLVSFFIFPVVFTVSSVVSAPPFKF